MSTRSCLVAAMTLLAWGCDSSRAEGTAPATDASPSDTSIDDGSVLADGSADPPIAQKYAAFAKAFDAERTRLKAPGAAVALMENGQLTFFHGFGTRGPSSNAPVDARTLFRIGSMTKSLTAAAFLHLVQTGATTLDATLTSIAPNVGLADPTKLPTLTMKELLTHTSGLADYGLASTSADDAELSQYLTSAEFGVDEFFNDPPGTFWDYANANYALVGLAIEKVGGQYYRQTMHDTLFAPLGMNRTFFLPSEVLADGDYTDGLASADWSVGDGGTMEVTPSSYDCAWCRPFGYAFSSVLDYERFMEFLYAGNPSVVGDSLRQQMQAFQVSDLLDGDLEGYGFGLINDHGFNLGAPYYGDTLVTHSGAIAGFSSEFYLVPSTGFGFVAFASTDNAYFSDSLILAMQSFGSLPSPVTPPSLGASASNAALAGTYVDPYVFGAITVGAGSSGLQISIPSADQAGLSYDKTLMPGGAPNVFTLNLQGVIDPEVTFIADGTGTFVWLRNRYFVGKRP